MFIEELTLMEMTQAILRASYQMRDPRGMPMPRQELSNDVALALLSHWLGIEVKLYPIHEIDFTFNEDF